MLLKEKSFIEEVEALREGYSTAIKEKKDYIELDFCISSLLKNKLISYNFRVNTFPHIPKTKVYFW